MWEDDDLPYHDYGSVYGEAAARAREFAALRRLIQQQQERQERLDALRVRQPSSVTSELSP